MSEQNLFHQGPPMPKCIIFHHVWATRKGHGTSGCENTLLNGYHRNNFLFPQTIFCWHVKISKLVCLKGWLYTFWSMCSNLSERGKGEVCTQVEMFLLLPSNAFTNERCPHCIYTNTSIWFYSKLASLISPEFYVKNSERHFTKKKSRKSLARILLSSGKIHRKSLKIL